MEKDDQAPIVEDPPATEQKQTAQKAEPAVAEAPTTDLSLHAGESALKETKKYLFSKLQQLRNEDM